LLFAHHFEQFLSLRQLNQLGHLASVIAISFPVSDSNPAATFQLWAHMCLAIASHFNRFIFLHQLNRVPKTFSGIAGIPQD
jgi:hypothetical protein